MAAREYNRRFHGNFGVFLMRHFAGSASLPVPDYLVSQRFLRSYFLSRKTMTETVSQAVTEPTTEPMTQLTTRPLIQPAAQPATQSAQTSPQLLPPVSGHTVLMITSI